MEVIINGIQYVPKCDVKQLNDVITQEVLEQLTSLRYFNLSTNKMRAQAWDAINAINSVVAKLSPSDAYNLVHGIDEDK